MDPSKPNLALLTPADSRQRARKLFSWGVEQRVAVESALQSTHEDWLRDWGLSEPERRLSFSNQLSDDLARQTLGAQLFGPEPVLAKLPRDQETCSSIVQAVADEAWDDWQMRLGRAVTGDGQSSRIPFQVIQANSSDPMRFSWDGRMDINFPWWSGQWSVRLDSDAVLHLLEVSGGSARVSPPVPQTAMIPLTTALARQPMEVKAHFTAVSLTLGQIQGLRIGDVIPLAQNLDEPAELRLQVDADKTFPLCAAWLGQRTGRMAAELAAL